MTSKVSQPPGTAHGGLADALAHIQSGREEQGLAVLNRLLERDPGALEARGHRAWLHKNAGRLALAVEDYRFLIEQRPEDRGAVRILATTLLELGLYREAIQAAMQVLDVEPFDAPMANLIRLAQVRSGAATEERVRPEKPHARANGIPPLIHELEHALASATRMASVHAGVGQFLHGLTRLLNPGMVIETGTFIGYSSLMIAAALKANRQGHLHSFDLFVNPLAAHPLAARYRARDMHELVEMQARAAGLEACVTYHKGDSSRRIAGLLANIQTPVGMAFIDGDHRARGCLRDWNVIAPSLREQGVIVLHDTSPEKSGWLGPRYLMEQLGADPADWAILDLPTADELGLAVIQKLNPRAGKLDWRPSLRDLTRQYLLHRLHGWKQAKPD